MATLPGVTRAELNFGAAKLNVAGSFDPGAVIKEAAAGGLGARPAGEENNSSTSLWLKYSRVIIPSLSGLLIITAWFFKWWGYASPLFQAVFLAAMVIGGYTTGRKALYNLSKLRFDMNVLMVVAVAGAVLLGEWTEGAVVAFLFSVSASLEAYTVNKARQAIKSLMDLAPKEALVRRGGQLVILPVEEILVGDVILIKPGEKIPVDGKVILGYSAVNQAPITGESVPVEKGPEDQVFAGTINHHGLLEVETTKLVQDTTLSRIIHMVEEAQAKKAPTQAFVERFAAVYTPIVLVLAAGIVLVPPIFFNQPWAPWIYRGLALLVVSCPCALVVSTPVAMVSAIGNAARHGVLIKGGAYLEQAGTLTAVAFDKTGTLTKGKPLVTDLIPAPGVASEKVLTLAASLEQLSQHPLARAVMAKAETCQVQPLAVDELTDIPGQGLVGQIEGVEYRLGSPSSLIQAGVKLDAFNEQLNTLMGGGKTVMVLSAADRVLGIIGLADEMRPGVGKVVKSLKDAGIKTTIMLTGDHQATAEAIASQTGVNEFMAGLLPEDKANAVHSLRQKYGKVAMVGDGINDTPAMAAASLGIAMGGSGADTALETADIVLMADDLSKLPFTIKLSRAALGVIKQNIALALGLKFLAVAFAIFGWLTLWLAIMADMGASLLVTLNGIRLLRMGAEPEQETCCGGHTHAPVPKCARTG